jgi:hypothetical protein
MFYLLLPFYCEMEKLSRTYFSVRSFPKYIVHVPLGSQHILSVDFIKTIC